MRHRRSRSQGADSLNRVLVIGGYGGFGARIARLLAQDGFTVIVGGRDAAKAKAFCDAQDEGDFEPAAVDRYRLDRTAIRRLDPWAMIDAAGPWQGDSYHLPRACIDAHCHYVDIADARAFVTGIGALDPAATDAGVTVISGASTAPALTAAVCDELARTLDRVTKIESRLTAGNRATGSASITGAVLSYAGKPIGLWRGGRWRTGFGWRHMERATFDRRGRPYRRLVGLCDVPDHDLLPARYPGAPTTTFYAGTEIGLQNRAIQLAALMVRWRLIPDGRWMSAPARFAQRLMRGIGGRRSAMRIRVAGWRGNEAIILDWEVRAERGDGPWIPCLAVSPLLTKLRDGDLEPGARGAAGALSLDDYRQAMAPFAIDQTIERRRYVPLYARVMGAAFDRLPPSVRAMHAVLGELVAQGEANVERGPNPLGRLIAWLFRFPRAGDAVPLRVWMDEQDGVEIWRRDFGGREMRSELSREGDLLVERFGPLRFGFTLTAEPGGLSMQLKRWWCGRLRLPLVLAPNSPAREYDVDGRFHLDVPISLPLIGLVVRYRGWLVPEPRRSPPAPSA